MKKHIVYSFLFVLTTLTIYACKKEVLTTKEFVEQKIVGTWPLRYTISTVYINDVAIKSDTLNKGLPVDTLVFSIDGRVVKRNKVEISSSTYQIDETGDNITFGTTPSTTQKIIYVRPLSIGLTSEIISGSTKIITEDQLIKLN